MVYLLLAALAAAPILAIGAGLETAEPAASDPYAAPISELRNRDPKAARQAEDSLVKAGPAAIPALVRVLHKAAIREPYWAAIGRMGPKALPALLDLTLDEELRNTAGDALYHVAGPGWAPQIPALLECMKRIEIKNYCGLALTKAMSPKGAVQLPLLVQALKSEDASVRAFSAAAIGMAKGSAASAVPALIEALKDPSSMVRMGAAKGLGMMGRKARPAVLALQAMSSADPDGEVRRTAMEALKSIRGYVAGQAFWD